MVQMDAKVVRIGLLVALLSAPTAAGAQDVLTVAPTVFKQVMDNNRMRVLEGTFKPGEQVGVHSHPDHMIYMLTPGTLVIKPPGRTPYEMTYKVGEATYLAAQTRALENGGDKAVRVLIVEMKAAAPVSAKRAGKSQRPQRSKRQRRR
jgi:quercetin dioxygenase-like cupin family protein